jgi:putative transposase
MPRQARVAPGGVIYHVMNRAAADRTLFRSPADYQAFLIALNDTLKTTPMRVLAFCIMPNHWHLLLWPEKDGDLARFMLRLTTAHVRRWLNYRKLLGTGHVYQGRYKSFPMESDEHFTIVARYVERNAVRAKLARRAERWPFCSAGRSQLPQAMQIPLTAWPIPKRRDWMEWINAPQTAKEEEAIRRCIREGRPYGSVPWVERTMKKFGWREPRPAGRPPKKK